MIVDNSKYQFKIRKHLNKRYLSFIAYEKKDEIIILRQLFNYTKNFIIISSLNKNILENSFIEQFFYCNSENFIIKLKKVFEMNEHLFEYDILNSDFSYIVFIKEDSKKNNYFDYFIRCYDFSFLVSQFRKYSFCKLLFLDNNAVLFLSDEKMEMSNYAFFSKNNKFIYGENELCICPFWGIGDYFLLYSIIKEFFIKSKKEIYIPVINNIQIMESKIYFPRNKKVYFDNESMFNFVSSKNFENVYDIHNIFISKYLLEKNANHDIHITSLIKELLQLNQNFDVYKYEEELKKYIINSIDNEEKKYIDDVVSNNVIGVQFFSGIFDEENSIWKTDTSRIWDNKNIDEFYDICLQNDLRIVNLVPMPNEHIPSLGNLSTEGYIYAISKLQLLVGIDSSAGHIASFYNVPSITIFNDNPFTTKKQKSNYRPLRNNISLYPKDNNIASITYDKVFDIVNACKNNSYSLSINLNHIGFNDYFIKSDYGSIK